MTSSVAPSVEFFFRRLINANFDNNSMVLISKRTFFSSNAYFWLSDFIPWLRVIVILIPQSRYPYNSGYPWLLDRLSCEAGAALGARPHSRSAIVSPPGPEFQRCIYFLRYEWKWMDQSECRRSWEPLRSDKRSDFPILKKKCSS